jgi:GNAT superfamily N-acetyltransferase
MTESPPPARIRPATEQDVSVILELIRGLADYERLSSAVVATEDDLRRHLFGDRSAAEAVLAHIGSQPIGFAVFFSTFSTFLGRPGVYIEDIFIVPEWRQRGYGRQVLGHIAGLAVGRGCGRLEWSVLGWNEPAIRFYESLGARALDEWQMYRLTGEPLHRLGSAGV